MTDPTTSDFLIKLKREAESQAKLEKTRFFPAELDFLTSFIGRHPWQVLVVASGATSIALELLKYVL